MKKISVNYKHRQMSEPFKEIVVAETADTITLRGTYSGSETYVYTTP
jgi:hypothetical protein